MSYRVSIDADKPIAIIAGVVLVVAGHPLGWWLVVGGFFL